MEKLVDQLFYDDPIMHNAGKLSTYNELLDSEHHKGFLNKKTGEYTVFRYVVNQSIVSQLALSLYKVGICDLRFSFSSTAEVVFRSHSFNKVENYMSNITLHIKKNGALFRTTSIKRMHEERLEVYREISKLVALNERFPNNCHDSRQATIESHNELKNNEVDDYFSLGGNDNE